MRPDLLLVAAFSLATSALSAQAVHQKNLLITMGVGAAAVVDLTDIAADNMDLKLF